MFINKRTRAVMAAAVVLTSVSILGCSDNPVSPGKDLQVANVADNFQFQVTALQNYSTSYQYTWANTGTAATVNQASSLTGGTAVLVVRDNAGTQVYARSQAENGTFDTTTGVAGSWTITLTTNKASGTINFRVQRKP
jgi:hypothetical protein